MTGEPVCGTLRHLEAAVLVLLLALVACVKEEPEAAPPAATEAPAEAPSVAPAEATLVGTVVQKPWSKSVESWNAGGSDYFVLDVAGAPVEDRTADEGVILRPSAAVTAEQIGAQVGKKVQVTGVYVAGEVPKVDPMMQYPMGEGGAPLPTGGGFEVRSLAPAP